MRIKIVVPFLLAAATASAEALPQKMLEICKQREADAKKVEAALTADVTSNCGQQIRASIAECNKDPAVKDQKQSQLESQGFNGVPEDENGFGRIGMKKSRDEALAAYESSQALYTRQADLCAEQKSKVQQACDEDTKGLKTAFNENNRQWRTVQDDLAKATTPAAKAPLNEQSNQHRLSSLQLQKQMSSTANAQSAADRAMTNSRQCSTNQSLIYKNAADETRQQAASVAANAEPDADKTVPGKGDVGRVNAQSGTAGTQTGAVNAGANNPGGDQSTAGSGEQQPNAQAPAAPQTADAPEKKLKANGEPKTLEELKEEERLRVAQDKDFEAQKKQLQDGMDLKKKVDPAFSAAVKKISAPTGFAKDIYDGNYGDAAMTAGKWTAEKVFVPETAFRLNFAATVVYETMKPSPLGTCDVMYYDPVVAYQANCQTSTPQGSSAQQRAISSLGGD